MLLLRGIRHPEVPDTSLKPHPELIRNGTVCGISSEI